MVKKSDLADIIKFVESNSNYKVLSTEYKGGKSQLELLCPVHGPIFMQFNNFRYGKRCRKCADNYNSKESRYSIDEVREIIKKDGRYTMVADIYTGNKGDLHLNCPSHGDFKMSLTSLQRGSGCTSCGRAKTVDGVRYDYNEVKRIVDAEPGYSLISKSYTNGKDKIRIMCDKHGEYSAPFYSFLQGCRCQKCGIEKGIATHKYTYEEAKAIVEAVDGYKLLSPLYEGSHVRMEMLCPIHGPFWLDLNHLGDGQRCPECSLNKSKEETEVYDFVKIFCPDAVQQNSNQVKTPGGRKWPLDVYIPSKKLALEYCGHWWHRFNPDSDGEMAAKYDRHFIKMKACEKAGIRLLTVFEDEWVNRNEQTKGFLEGILTPPSNKIYARNCEVKQIENKVASDFVEKYHLQGSASCKVAFGIFFEDNLLGVVTGAQHHRSGHEGDFVLRRLCFASGTSITGAASKLMAPLIEYARSEGYKRLISWSDNRWSQGKVYEATGFKMDEEMVADYSYFKGSKRCSKQSCRKADLEKQGAVGATESIMAKSLGLERIFDCGKKRWVLDL